MFQPNIHYSRARTERLTTLTVLVGIFVLIVLTAALRTFYEQSKLEGVAEYKATCITNFQNGYLTVRTQCQPGYRSK